MNLSYSIVSYMALLLSISVHECSHAWSANYFGDETAKRMGRLTINPIPHIDPFGTLLFPMLMIFSGSGFLIGWAKPVPVDLRNLKNPRKDNLWISFAGPLSNLALAGIFALLFHTIIRFTNDPLSSAQTSVIEPFIIFVYMSIRINVILAIFNMIPVFPLDGSGVISGLLPYDKAVAFERMRPYGFLILMILLFTNILGVIITPVSNVIFSLLGVG